MGSVLLIVLAMKSCIAQMHAGGRFATIEAQMHVDARDPHREKREAEQQNPVSAEVAKTFHAGQQFTQIRRNDNVMTWPNAPIYLRAKAARWQNRSIRCAHGARLDSGLDSRV